MLVVGGGPAGLEAARVSAERGHDVVLVEASAELGGQWRLAGHQPSRSQVLDHLAWYAAELERLGVEIRRGRSVAGGDVVGGAAPTMWSWRSARRRRWRASSVRCASPTGYRDVELGRATTAQDVLAGVVAVAGRVLVVDDVDDWRGIGTAMFLQERGCTVTIATAAPAVAAGLYHSAADAPGSPAVRRRRW